METFSNGICDFRKDELMAIWFISFLWTFNYERTVEIVYNETGYNEQPDITSKSGAEVWSRI